MKNNILCISYQAYSEYFCSARIQIAITKTLLLFLLLPTLATAIPLPDKQHFFTPYPAVGTPKVGSDAHSSRPIAVAGAADENGNLHLHVRTGALDAPMDAYFAILAQPIAPNTMLILAEDGSLQPMTSELKPWKTRINHIDEAIFDGIALGNLPKGSYTFFLLLNPAGSNNPLQDNYYLWSSTLELTAAKDLPPSSSTFTLDNSTVIMGDKITLNHSSIQTGVPVTITYNDGSDLNVSTTAIPIVNGRVSVITPPLITEEPPYLRSGAVDVSLQGESETASFYIIKPPELENTLPGEITSMVLQFSLDKLQATLDGISSMSSEEQGRMTISTSAINAQKEALLERISQTNNQMLSIEMENDFATVGATELALIDRLVLVDILTTSAHYTAIQAKSLPDIRPRRSGQDNLDEINRRIAEIRENANGLAENTLNAIKNVGIPGTQVLVNGITVGLGIVALTTSSVPVAWAASGTAAFVVLIQTTGLFTTTLVLEPTIDAVNGRVADLGQAAVDGLNVLVDGFISISLTALGEIKWVGANAASLVGLSRDSLAGFSATSDLICNTEQPKVIAKAINSNFCTISIPPISSGIEGIWSTTYGAMTFPDVLSGSIRAPYTNDEGRIIGAFSGHKLVGKWVEKGSAVKCDSQLDSSFYWGKVIFTFNADFSEFSGLWGYCDNEPTRSWAGSKD